MDAAYKEFDDLRLEMETLREEHRAKVELSERLRRAHDEQFALLQEAKTEIEKQSKEIRAKSEAISSAKQMYEELKSSLSGKEYALKQLGLANENLRSSGREQVMHLEAKNRELGILLAEANAEREQQGRTISACKEEIEGLKNRLMQSEKKCLDAEIRAQAPNEVRRRDEMLLKLEEEKVEVENQLKWKMEQFRHLEEAHNKLQDEFRVAKREWGTEKFNLVDEIQELQNNLDSQIRVAEELRCQLMMCNRALAHEESRRRLLETQISESKLLYDKIVSEYEEARLTIETLTAKRDEEIASLRSSFSTKAALLKECEFRRIQLEQENKELQMCLKEHQEAHINRVDSATSLKTLRQKFKTLEQAHRSCSEKLKASETEWGKHSGKLKNDLDECLFQLSDKDRELAEFQIQLDGNQSLLMQQKQRNEELSTLLLVVKSKFSELSLELENFRPDKEKYSAELLERIALLAKQLQEKNAALIQSQIDSNQKVEIVNSLQTRIEYLESIEPKYYAAQKELEKYKEMIEESSTQLCFFKQQACQKENALQDGLAKISDALERANCSLTEKTNDLRKMEFELQQQKIVLERVEKLKYDLEIELKNYSHESKAMRKELEVAHLANIKAEERVSEYFRKIIEEKDKSIEDLKQHNILLEGDNARQKLEFTTLVKAELKRSSEKENKKIFSSIEEIDCRLNQNERALSLLEQRYMSRESEIITNFDKEKANLLEVLEDKENAIADLRECVLLLEQDFNHSVESAVASKLTESKHEVFKLYKMIENIVAAYIFGEQEIHFKNMLISELEKETASLQVELRSEEKLSFDMNKLIEQLKTELSKQRLENERKHSQVLLELKCLESVKFGLESQLSELKVKLKSLHGMITMFSVEKERLVGEMMGFTDSISMIFHKDEQLIRNWERLLLKATDKSAVVDPERKDHLSSYAVDVRNCNSCSRQKAEQNAGKRSPLKEHNF